MALVEAPRQIAEGRRLRPHRQALTKAFEVVGQLSRAGVPPFRIARQGTRHDLVEVAAVEALIEGEGEPLRVAVDPSQEELYAPGLRVIEADGLSPAAARRLRIRVFDAADRLVTERLAVADNRRPLSMTILITRDCAGVECSDPAAPACLRL